MSRKSMSVEFLRGLIKSREAERTTAAQFFGALTAVILARNLVESVLEGDQVLGFTPLVANSFYSFFDHFFLFYASIFIWLVLLLSLLTGEDSRAVGRMAVLFSPLILIVPLVDVALSRGAGYRLGYLVGASDVLPAMLFFDIRGELHQVTWGQRIEVLAVCCLASAYVWLKRGSRTRSILAFVIVYIAMFVHGLPQLLAEIPRAFGHEYPVRATVGGGLVDFDSQNYSFFMLALGVPAAFAVARLSGPDIWKGLKAGFRSGRCWLPAVAAVVGLLLGYLSFREDYNATFVNPYNYLAFAAVACAFFLVAARPAEPVLALVPVIIAFFLSLNAGWTCLVLVAAAFALARMRRTFGIILALALAGGFSLFAQDTAWTLFFPGGGRKLAAFAAYRQGREHFIRNEWSRARDLYEKSAELGRANHELYERLAETYVNLGEPDKAIPPFQYAAETSRNDPEPYLGLGGIYLAKGDFDSAIAISEEAIERRVLPDRFHLEIGRIYSRMGRFEEARRSLERAAALGAKRDVLYQALGDLAFFGSKGSEAIDSYKRVLRYNPRSALAYNGIATVHHVAGDYAKALEFYKKAVDLAPDNATILNNTGAAYLDLGMYDQAYTMVSRALALYPMLAEGHYNMGRILESAGAMSAAAESYRRALRINPNTLGAKEALDQLEADPKDR